MAKVIVIARVDDYAKWEEGFRTHGGLFRSQTVNKPIHFANSEGNEVVICFEPEDVDRFMEIVDSQATVDAMRYDGVQRETVKMVVLDGEFQL